MNSGNLINHWSMNWVQFKETVTCVLLALWSLTQDMAGLSPFNDKYFCHWIRWMFSVMSVCVSIWLWGGGPYVTNADLFNLLHFGINPPSPIAGPFFSSNRNLLTCLNLFTWTLPHRDVPPRTCWRAVGWPSTERPSCYQCFTHEMAFIKQQNKTQDFNVQFDIFDQSKHLNSWSPPLCNQIQSWF